MWQWYNRMNKIMKDTYLFQYFFEIELKGFWKFPKNNWNEQKN